jgi:hypothetical protein
MAKAKANPVSLRLKAKTNTQPTVYVVHASAMHYVVHAVVDDSTTGVPNQGKVTLTNPGITLDLDNKTITFK